MDKITQTLAKYVTSLQFDQLSAGTIHHAKTRLIDTIGCAIGGYSSEPAAIARQIASDNGGRPLARVLGSGASTSMEMAAFANAVMVRYLDFNDTYISMGSGHPSDMIPACLAVAEAHHASGRDTLLAVTTAYEVFTSIADAVCLRDRGWDQALYVVLGSAAGAARLLGLTEQQTGDALAIAVSSNVATRQTRSGELSMWKGCATASAARAGVFAALLAQRGMTGPTAAFEGRHGVWDQVTGPFELEPLGGDGVGFGIARTNLKFFPAEYHSQAPLAMALALRDKVRIEDIEAISVQTYYTAYSEIGSEPEKWDPQTRETADHSLPYLLALALKDGCVNMDSFSPQRLRDPELWQLMRRIAIAENPAFTRQYPSKMVSEIEVLTRDGQRLVETASFAKGHAQNPLSDAEVESKFGSLCEGLLPPRRREAILRTLWDIDQAADIGRVIELVQVEN
ncbi:MAG: MmgE/PrpD family protein [Chloroflexota bacterium]